MLLTGIIAGCGGGDGAKLHRVKGLAPDKVVATFYERAKNQKLEEAALYIAPTSLKELQGVGGFLKNDLELSEIQSSNLLMAKPVAEQGGFAVVLATLQDGINSTKITVKAVGLEKIDGEWYIVDFKTAYKYAKYEALESLLKNIL
jgi:hypothetical protein